MIDPLDSFLPAVREWFRARYGEPTPPQTLGWPAIQRGEHTLILSPTGSGKTLAAFLWGIDAISRRLAEDPERRGVQLLYISPLKALNNDIERNLREPLAGIRQTARSMGEELPTIVAAVRTGDTPQSARQRMVRKPPHILITTPESLYLILTSPRARDILRTVETVILDEIHTLCGNKRGVHLALSLERLGLLTGRTVQRIGLSATQRPLDEVGRFLVGQEWEPDKEGGERLVSRGLTIVDAGAQKDLDLRVVTVVPDLRQLPGGSIWPSLIPDVLGEIRRHRTTLLFVNSRRAAERAADRLNEQYAMEEAEIVAPGSPEGLLEGGVPVGQGIFGTGQVEGPFRAHHGSISKELRLDLERQLKAGELPALIGTSSLELGIDIGSVDAVVQLGSPRGIARGLQRVGRSGHLVGQTSVGRIYATYREDLLDAAAVAHGMLGGDIEPTYTPQNCLDVLAQQVVAMVAVEDWPIEQLHRLVRQVYGYGKLTGEAFRAVLRMISGGYSSEVYRGLRARIAWDRVHDTLSALPGSRLLAIRNGGTIASRGEFRVTLPDRKTVLGTLDEEFVYETRRGDVFTLGSSTWRVLEIDEDKMVVGNAAGSIPRMPFWNGELPKRDYHMGLRLGAFRRQLAERIADLPPFADDPAGTWPEEAHDVIEWLADEYALDEPSARNAIVYVRRQMDVLGAISSDKTVIIELFNDALGDQRLAIHSCFGGRINSAWALALSHALREERGLQIETQANDDGILFRFLQADRKPPVDLVREMGAEEARERLLAELPGSALFGAHFRMNASRALLLPKVRGNRRTPFWLQRLRAKDLLAAAKGFDDFPLIAETYRDCLRDVLDLEHLMDVLAAIQSGEIRVVVAETLVPSPVAASLLSEFMAEQIYEWDAPKVERQIQALSINRELLAQLLDDGMLPDLLRPEALDAVERELQHLAEGYRARSAEELALILHELGDLSSAEVGARALGEGRAWLLRLAAEGRAFEIELPTSAGPQRRWIAAEDYRRYRDALGLPQKPPMPLPPDLLEPHRSPEAAREVLLRVIARSHGPLTRGAILARHAFPDAWLDETLAEMVDTGHLVAGRLSPGVQEREWCDRHVLERIHRRTLSLLRAEIRPVEPPAYADFMARWQGAHPAHRRAGVEGLAAVMQQLRGLVLPAMAWERDVLPVRLRDYRPVLLDELCAEGDLLWVAEGPDPRHVRLRFLFRGEGAVFLGLKRDEPAGPGASPPLQTLERGPGGEVLPTLPGDARAVHDALQQEGACYARDLQHMLGLSGAALDAALVELVLAGLVTNDRFQAMRVILSNAWAQPETKRGLRSSLDADLAAWRAARDKSSTGKSRSGRFNRPPRGRLRDARREVARRIPPPSRWSGRWSLVHCQGVLGRPPSEWDRVARQARQLLQRYGIVTRECLDNEESHWSWPAIYRQLELMEMRGEVRRGYFVRGLPGMQFALPEAVDQLRAWDKLRIEGHDDLEIRPKTRQLENGPASRISLGQSRINNRMKQYLTQQPCRLPSRRGYFSALPLVLLSACDPANLYGPALEAIRGQIDAGLADECSPARFARLPSNVVVLQRGVPILLYEHGGGRWKTLPQADEGTLRRALRLCLDRLTREGGLCAQPRRVLVVEWNGVSAIDSDAQPLLESLGFRREPPAMIWDGL